MPADATHLTQSDDPASFKGRGIAVPFTTPLLAAARIRQAATDGTELVVPNPSGGTGVYVMGWAGIRSLCNPTVHDTLLHQLIARIRALSPRAVRDAALAIALDGHAGRAGSAAAKAVIATDRAQRLRANFLLMRTLMEQAEPGSAGGATRRTSEFDLRCVSVLNRLAARIGLPAEQLAAAMTAIGDAFAPVGTAHDDQAARIPRLVDFLERTSAAISAWLEADPGHDLFGVGPALVDSIEWAARAGRIVAASTQDILSDPLALLVRRFADSAGVAALAERADWLLDGWERVCQLWACAVDTSARRVALVEMARCLPEIPAEAFAWTNPSVRLPAPNQTCRVTGGDRSWFAGSTAFTLVERNERMRARTV